MRPGFQDEDPEPSTYPIVLGDLAVVCDDDGITAYHMNVRPSAGNAEEVANQVLAWESRLHTPHASRPPRVPGASPRYSLSASGDRIFARLGSTSGRGGGTLIAVRNNREIEGKLLWSRQAHEIELPRRLNEPNRLEASYEGTPVADADRVYIALTEAATETWVYVACLDAETGRTIWVRYLGNASSAFDQMRQTSLGTELGQRLLTLDGQTVYYQTNMGALAALDADTGAVRWLATYPTTEENASNSLHRGLNPAIAHGGLVIVAPDDSAPIFAFDSASGEIVWKTPPVNEIKHLLGVAQGKLFATGNHLFSFDVKTGQLTRPAWPEGGGFESFGRGLLAGDKVYCPTRTEILVFDQATGGQAQEPIPLFQDYFDHEGGNLAVGDGYLVVAERNRLVVYCQNSRLIERYQQLIVEQPDRASNHFQLARLAEATGRPDLALESLESASRLARPSDLVDGQPLASVAQARAHNLLMNLAREDVEKQDFAAATALYERAVATSLTDRERLTARLEQSEAQARAGEPEKAVENLQALLADERLNGLTVAADERRTLRAELLIADRLCGLVREHGPRSTPPSTARPRPCWTRASPAGRPPAPRGRSELPAAQVAPDALLALASLSEAMGSRPRRPRPTSDCWRSCPATRPIPTGPAPSRPARSGDWPRRTSPRDCWARLATPSRGPRPGSTPWTSNPSASRGPSASSCRRSSTASRFSTWEELGPSRPSPASEPALGPPVLGGGSPDLGRGPAALRSCRPPLRGRGAGTPPDRPDHRRVRLVGRPGR